jgi:hypothetical protein
MAFKGATLTALLVLCSSGSLSQVSDSDADLVPDALDNCLVVANGPNDVSNQTDSDLDGYGNACDPDYNNDWAVDTRDYGVLLSSLTGPGTVTDHDGNGIVTVTDFAVLLEYFTNVPFNVPGPSGLACAGVVPCTP